MIYDSFIVSYASGTSGNFITQLLDRLILGYKPILLSDTNNCHVEMPFTGIAHSDAWNDPKIYEYFTFQDESVREYKFSKILTTHVYPDFEIINNRYKKIGVILIEPDQEDAKEIFFNMLYKTLKKIPTPKEHYLYLKNLPKHYKKQNNYPENCLVLKYKEIYETVGEKYCILETLTEFTGIDSIPKHLNIACEQYISNRTKIINQYNLR